MGNRQRGEVSFEVNGVKHVLRFSMNAICELEAETGKAFPEVAAELQGEPGFRTIRAVFWAGLTDHLEGVTVRQAGEIMGDLGIAAAGELIGQALELAFPDEDAPGKATASKAA